MFCPIGDAIGSEVKFQTFDIFGPLFRIGVESGQRTMDSSHSRRQKCDVLDNGEQRGRSRELIRNYTRMRTGLDYNHVLRICTAYTYIMCIQHTTIPFNMAVLVYLYKHGMPFPKNSAELYDYFICITIYRHLAKSGNNFCDIITEFTELPRLTDLPEPCSRIIQQLSKLSLEALSDNKLIFTLNEIKSACPDIAATPEAINGLGLLQSVQHYGLIGTTMTFNFLHFSIQEYLAAHYITTLPADEELKIIKEKFWSDTHLNMFSIYVALTKGQRPVFKQFLCYENKAILISDVFLENQLQCFRLYHCFHEAGDVDICKTIEHSVTFRNKVIELSDTRVTAGDMECITQFFTLVLCKEWMILNLSYCYIQDHGLHILRQGLLHCNDVIIDKLWLSHNGLTTQSFPFISDIIIHCKVKALWIEGNHITENNNQLYTPCWQILLLN